MVHPIDDAGTDQERDAPAAAGATADERAGRPAGTTRELVAYLRARRKWHLAPLLGLALLARGLGLGRGERRSQVDRGQLD